MAAVLLRLRAELRRSWPGVVALAVLVGIFGGAVIAATAAARRTDSVLARLVAASNEPDVFVPMFDGGPIAPLRPADVRSAPETDLVIEVRELRVAQEMGAIGALDERLGSTHLRPNLLAGRRADPARTDEVVVNHLAAAAFDLAPGDPLTIAFAPPGAPSEAGSFAFAPGEAPDGARPTRLDFTITGVVASSGDLVAVAEPQAIVTPAFLRAHPELAYDAFMMVWLHGGRDDIGALREHLTRFSDGDAVFLIDGSIGLGQTQRSFHLQATAIWLLAAAIAVTAILVLGQMLARQSFLESRDFATLGALGFSRGQLAVLGLARAAVAAVIGGVLASALGFFSTLVTPFGRPAIAEPDPGARFDAFALAGGGAAVLVLTVMLAVLPAIRAARVLAARARAAQPRTRSRLASALARAFRRPGPAIGARMALEPGSGASAVPVRTTFGGIVLGLAALVAALTVASSMDRLLTTPRLYGWNWDAQVGGEEGDARPQIAKVDGLEAVAVGAEFVPLAIGGASVVAFAMESVIGDVQPTILEGKAPADDDEIALGRGLLARLDVSIGDTIEVAVEGTDDPRTMTVVGSCVFPRIDDSASVGEGAFITLDAMYALYPPAPPPTNAFVRFAPGHEREQEAELREVFGDEGVELAAPPSSVLDFGAVSGMPTIFAAMVALLAIGTLAHGLVTTIRRRRRDLAILKSLGFVRRQVRGAVAWQATITTSLCIALALPIGLAVGRWLWTVIARGGGFVVEPKLPVLAATLAIPAAIVLANAVASIPARAAARTRPALVLRAE